MTKPLATLLAIVAPVSGCSATAPARCDTDGMDPQPRLTCEMAIDAARARLATVADVTEIDVRYGGFCPAGGRCRPFQDDLTNATVIVRRAGGDDLALIISLHPDGTVSTTDAAPMPGPTTLPEG